MSSILNFSFEKHFSGIKNCRFMNNFFSKISVVILPILIHFQCSLTDDSDEWSYVRIYENSPGSIIIGLFCNSKGNLFVGVPGGMFFLESSSGKWKEVRYLDSVMLGFSMQTMIESVDGIHVASGVNMKNRPSQILGSSDYGYTWGKYVEERYSIKFISIGNKIFSATERAIFESSGLDSLGVARSLFVGSQKVLITGDDHAITIVDVGKDSSRCYYSTNYGKDWVRIQTNIIEKEEIMQVATDGRHNIILVSASGSVYKMAELSTSVELLHKVNWRWEPDALLAHGGIIAFGTLQNVAVSTDYGISWREMNKGFRTETIRAFALDSSGYLYAGFTSGLYRLNGQLKE